MAENKMFSGVKKGAKRVPKWAWYIGGGVLIAAIVYNVRQRQAVDESAGDQTSDQGVVGYTDASQAPGIIVPAQLGGEAVPAEINTDIPVATLDLLGGIIGDLSDIVAHPSGLTVDDILQILAGAGSPQAGGDSSGVVAVAPVSAPTAPTTTTAPAPTAPKPNPCAALESGYHCGSTITDGDLHKSFSGAIGWARVASGLTGADHWIDYHVRFCSRLERWRVHPNRTGSPWAKVWAGDRPNIC